MQRPLGYFLALVIALAGIGVGVLVQRSLAADYIEVDADVPTDATWLHKHYNYPSKPSGLSGIRNVFGEHCNDNANAERMTWKAADNGTRYRNLSTTLRHLPSGISDSPPLSSSGSSVG